MPLSLLWLKCGLLGICWKLCFHAISFHWAVEGRANRGSPVDHAGREPSIGKAELCSPFEILFCEPLDVSSNLMQSSVSLFTQQSLIPLQIYQIHSDFWGIDGIETKKTTCHDPSRLIPSQDEAAVAIAHCLDPPWYLHHIKLYQSILSDLIRSYQIS